MAEVEMERTDTPVGNEAEQVRTHLDILKEMYDTSAETIATNDAILAVADDLIRMSGAAIEPLIETLSNPTLRFFAIFVLGQIGDARATEPLLKLLAEENEAGNEDVLHIITALGRIGDPRAVAPLIDLLIASEQYAIKASPEPSLLHSDLFEVIAAWLFRRRRGVSAQALQAQYLQRQLPICLIQ